MQTCFNWGRQIPRCIPKEYREETNIIRSVSIDGLEWTQGITAHKHCNINHIAIKFGGKKNPYFSLASVNPDTAYLANIGEVAPGDRRPSLSYASSTSKSLLWVKDLNIYHVKERSLSRNTNAIKTFH